jgi:hypothetical protein
MCDSLIDYMSCDNIKQIKQFVHEVSDDGRVASTTCLYVTAKTKIEPKYNTEETVK